MEEALIGTMDMISTMIFGISLSEAQDKMICLHCKESVAGKLDETEDKKIYLRDGLCPACQKELSMEEGINVSEKNN